MRNLCFTLLLTLGYSALTAQTNGVSYFGHLDQPHGSGYAGCWGYTGPDGREYVITGATNGTSIIDITDSSNVHEVAYISGPSSLWREMRTHQDRAYVVTEAGGGVQIINLANLPIGANLIRSFNYSQGSNNISASHTIEIFDGYMYLNGCANWPPGGTLIFSLANKDTPVFVGQYQPPGTGSQRYVHDSYLRNDTLFAASIYTGGGINIANVANKTSPAHITKISYSNSGTHNVWTTKDGRYVISTDEIGTTPKNLKFWNLATLPVPPPSPSATYTFNPSDIVHNVTVRGNFAYVAWYTAGLVVVNVTNPLSPQTAGWYDTYPGPSGGYDGVWAVYPYFPSGKIAVSDMTSGTWIFRFNGLAPRRAVQLLSPSDGDSVFNTRTTQFRWTSAADMQADPHYYVLSITGPGVNFQTNVSDTVFSSPFLTGFQSGETYSWTITTRDEVNTTASADTFQFLYQPAVAALSASTDTLDFGEVVVDSTETLPLQITNTGNAPLVIDSIRTTDNIFTTDFAGPVTVQPDSSYVAMVSFTPSALQLYEAVLQIFSNAYGQPQTDIRMVGTGSSPTAAEDQEGRPTRYVLQQNFPNPFNPSTTIAYSLGQPGRVILKIYNILGEEVASLVENNQAAGSHTVSFDASGLPSGLYFYKLSAGNFTDVKKMILMK